MDRSIAEVFVLANEFKEGDLPVGGTRDDAVRREAKRELAGMRLGEIRKSVLIADGVSEAIQRALDRQLSSRVSRMTVEELKQVLLGERCAQWAKEHGDGLASEVIASVVKVMTDDELSKVACSIYNPLPGKRGMESVEIGSPNHLGSRIQPNSPGDDEEEILISTLEGLSFGCGDVILGLNPASDDPETIARSEELLRSIIERLRLPTRYCVLSDLVKQSTVRSMTKLDVGFQSLGGTSKSLAGMIGVDVDGIIELAGSFEGLYFETGQGSEATNGAAEGIDMVTLESRCYGLARAISRRCGGKWMLVNDVAGFIGPEVFRTGAQLQRACLEDMVMAKLHGITMGLDICSTFHMGIDPFELMALTDRITRMASPAYLMAVAGKADPMLGILTTSFREHPRLRVKTRRQVTSAMKERMLALGVVGEVEEATGDPARTAALYAGYLKEAGEARPFGSLLRDGLKKISALREKGFDLGYGSAADLSDPPAVSARIEAIFNHARKFLYAPIDRSVILDCCPRSIGVTTNAIDLKAKDHSFAGNPKCVRWQTMASLFP